MKLLFLIVVSICTAVGVFLGASVFFKHTKSKKFNLLPVKLAAGVLFVLFCLIAVGIFLSGHQPDLQCGKVHTTSSLPPKNLVSATDYFDLGNYDYDRGNCTMAVQDYTKAITLNPAFAQAYNNRAYTYMRLREYKLALSDLNYALQIHPGYVQALMNRGDLHNYYYQIDRVAAIADYEKVIAITGPTNGITNVCGHLFLAKHNGWTLGAFIDFFLGKFRSCK